MRYLLICFFALISIVACKNETTTSSALLSGSIINPTMNAVVVEGPNLNKTINLNEDDTFTETLNIESSGYYNLTHGRESTLIYLNPGDNLKIDFDANTFRSTITFEGKGAMKTITWQQNPYYKKAVLLNFQYFLVWSKPNFYKP